MADSKKKKANPANPPSPDVLAPLDSKTYDKELKRLHVELVKLQQWVVAKGLKVCIVFEGRDGARKKAAPSRPSPSASARASSVLSPCRHRPSARRARCTFNVISNTSRRQAKS